MATNVPQRHAQALCDALAVASCSEGFIDLVLDSYLGGIAFGLERQGTPTRRDHPALSRELGGALHSVRNLGRRARRGDVEALSELRRIRKKAPDKASSGLGGDNRAAYEVVERKLTTFFETKPVTVSDGDIAAEVDDLLTMHFHNLAMTRLLLEVPELAPLRKRVESGGFRLPARDDRLRLWVAEIENQCGRVVTAQTKDRLSARPCGVPGWEEMKPKDRARCVLEACLGAWGVKQWGVRKPSDLRSTLARRESPSRAGPRRGRRTH